MLPLPVYKLMFYILCYEDDAIIFIICQIHIYQNNLYILVLRRAEVLMICVLRITMKIIPYQIIFFIEKIE